MDDEKAIPLNEVSPNQAVLNHSDVEGQAPVTEGVDHESAATLYEKRAMVLNNAMQEIGMGRYQWALFFVTGSGYFADNLWLVGGGLILPALLKEFEFDAPLFKIWQSVGLLAGALLWGLGTDIWGRNISFNLTLLITGIFVVAAGGSPSYVALSSLVAVGSVGIGGNLPVDSAIFLEFVPATHQYLLTGLSIWWSFGQLCGSLIAWPLLSNFSCSQSPSTSTPCTSGQNKGWRFFLYTIGGLILLLWAVRFFCFTMHNSPKYLMGKGHLEEAVEVVKKVAATNGRESSLVVNDLKIIEEMGEGVDRILKEAEKVEAGEEENTKKDSGKGVRKILAALDWDHVKSLFSTRQDAYSTCLLVAIWGLIGLAFTLYNSFITYLLSTRGVQFGDGSTYTTYRNQVILSAIGVPGSIVSAYLVEQPILGRRGTLSLFIGLTGVFILASTTARTSNALLGWNCAYSFTSNLMYGVLYAITPELFLTKNRGTGNALAVGTNILFGLMAPIIAIYANLDTSLPIFISGSIFLVCGLLALLLPRETRGRAAL